MGKLVSIIVPVYQVEEYICRCLDSLIRQSCVNIEVIIVDDGSTDKSGRICDEYAQKDSRVHVIHKENGGLSSARNAGLDIAKGEYVTFVDSDDWVDSDYVRAMYEVCEENECDICQCGFFDETGDDLVHEDHGGVSRIYEPLEYVRSEFGFLSIRECVVSCGKLYRLALFEGIRFPKGRVHEDEFTTYRIVDRAERIAVLPTRLYHYRRRQDGIANSSGLKKHLDICDAFCERADYYLQQGCSDLAVLTKARHLQWLEWQWGIATGTGNTDKKIDDDVNKQIDKLKMDLSGIPMIRTDFLDRDFIFPFDQVRARSRIILYGGGNVGQQYFLQVSSINYCDVALWVDRDYKALREKGLPIGDVTGISELSDSVDYVVIAIERLESAKFVIKMLKDDFSISKDRIIYSIKKTKRVQVETCYIDPVRSGE